MFLLILIKTILNIKKDLKLQKNFMLIMKIIISNYDKLLQLKKLDLCLKQRDGKLLKSIKYIIKFFLYFILIVKY